MNLYDYRILIKLSDSVESTDFQVSAGVIMTTAVSLQKVSYEGLEGTEAAWVVVRAGNPPVIVLHTEAEAEAHRVYADEIDRARKAEGERTMWRR